MVGSGLPRRCLHFSPLGLILKYGVDFPYLDEWDRDFAGMYIKAFQHQLTFADLAAQHNEHRILIPRLILLILTLCTHWNPIADMIVQWLIVCTDFGGSALAASANDF